MQPITCQEDRAGVLLLIAGGSGTQLAAVSGPCAWEARAKLVLSKIVAIEFTGFWRTRLSWVLQEVSAR